MKKLYILFLLCFAAIGSFAQITTTTIYAIGAAGSYKSGNVTTTTRTSGNIITTDTTQRGWAVFDLGSIPAGTIIDSCIIGFNVSGYGGSGTPSGWDTYAFPGDLSTVTTAAALFPDCTSGTSISTGTYDTIIGNKIIHSNPTSQAFMTSRVGDSVSLCWTGGGTRVYTITGVAGTPSVIGTHAPYITLEYCTGVKHVAATATPGNLCNGATLTLTESDSGATSYSWAGPNSFTSTLQNPTLTVDTSSAGVYTLTVYNAGGCATSVTTSSVTVAFTPPPIAASTNTICPYATTTLLDPVAGGFWSTSPSTVATVNDSGVVTGVSSGTVVVTYACGAQTTTFDMTIKAPPSPIIGIDSLCQGAIGGLSDTSGLGTWSSSAPTIATVNSFGGITGISAGTAVITFTKTATTCFSTFSLMIIPLPTAVTGTPNECIGQTTTLSDAAPYGIWKSANASVATVDSIHGIVTGHAAGGVFITYTTGCGHVTVVNTVKPLPGAITGKDSVCDFGTTTLADDINGGTWTSNDTNIATVPSTPSGTAGVYGVDTGATIITYTLPTGCYITTPFTVRQLPDSITLLPAPLTACVGEPYVLFDSVAGGKWTTGDVSTAIINGNSDTLMGVHSGTVTVSYTVRPGCTTTTVLKVSDLPSAILGTKDICPGTVDTLTNDSVGGVWVSMDTAVATIVPSGVIYGVAGGNDTVKYTSPNGCSITGVESIYPRPVPVVTYDDGTFTVDTFGNVSYQWYTGANISDTTVLVGATSYRLAVLYHEYYVIEVTDTLGCTGELGINSGIYLNVKNINAQNGINCYPNPASSALYITAAQPVKAIISDMNGRKVIEQQNATQVDVSKLASGMYTISFYNENGTKITTQKFAKE